MPADQPLPRYDWVAEFSVEIQRLGRLNTGKFLHALAEQQWIEHQNEDPVKVAQAWAKRSGGKDR